MIPLQNNKLLYSLDLQQLLSVHLSYEYTHLPFMSDSRLLAAHFGAPHSSPSSSLLGWDGVNTPLITTNKHLTSVCCTVQHMGISRQCGCFEMDTQTL